MNGEKKCTKNKRKKKHLHLISDMIVSKYFHHILCLCWNFYVSWFHFLLTIHVHVCTSIGKQSNANKIVDKGNGRNSFYMQLLATNKCGCLSIKVYNWNIFLTFKSTTILSANLSLSLSLSLYELKWFPICHLHGSRFLFFIIVFMWLLYLQCCSFD